MYISLCCIGTMPGQARLIGGRALTLMVVDICDQLWHQEGIDTISLWLERLTKQCPQLGRYGRPGSKCIKMSTLIMKYCFWRQ